MAQRQAAFSDNTSLIATFSSCYCLTLYILFLFHYPNVVHVTSGYLLSQIRLSVDCAVTLVHPSHGV